jgi:hypothetical protein
MLFVFQFGFESPDERAINQSQGIDFESSDWVLIEAPDETAALSWGCEIAEEFVQRLCGESWRAGNFAYWVELQSDCPWAVDRSPVKIGEFPDFTEWLAERGQ